MHQTRNQTPARESHDANADPPSYNLPHDQSWEPSIDTIHGALDMTTDIVLFVDATDARIVHVNERACLALGYDRTELLQMCIGEIAVDANGSTLASRECDPTEPGEQLAHQSTYLQRKGGTRFPVELSVRHNPRDSSREAVIVARDISIRQRLEEISAQSPRHDPLTGLADRTVLEARIAAIADRPATGENNIALLFIDLDRFKTINDRFGHQAGDHVLRVVADRIVACTRPTDLIVRYGGDEFLVLIENVDDIDQVTEIARRLARDIPQTIAWNNTTLSIRASVGIASTTIANLSSFDSLVHHADLAMYRAKDGNTSTQWFFDDAAPESASARPR